MLINVYAMIVGFCVGICIYVFRVWLDVLENFYNYVINITSVFFGNLNPFHIILACAGGLAVGLIGEFISPGIKGSGIPEVIEAAALHRGHIPLSVGPAKIIASPITIVTSCGGKEGPIAQIGGWAGSVFGYLFRLNAFEIRLLMAAGMAGGVAGMFNAPLGGAVFALEILFNVVGIFSSIPIFIASIAAVTTVNSLIPPAVIIRYSIPIVFTDPVEFFLVILFGLISGVAGFVWVRFVSVMRKMFRWHVGRAGRILRPSLGAALAGTVIMFYPYHGLRGPGFDGIAAALSGSFPPLLMLMLALLKMYVTAVTLGAENSGGIFGPSLYIGCMLGGFFGNLFALLFPAYISDPSVFIVLGMASVFTAASLSPINMSILIAEMTKNFWLVSATMLSCAASFVIAWTISGRKSLYTLKADYQPVRLHVGSLFLLHNINAEEIIDTPPVKLYVGAEVGEALEIARKFDIEVFPVVDTSGPIGIVRKTELEKTAESGRSDLPVGDLVERNVPSADMYSKIQHILDLIYLSGGDAVLLTSGKNGGSVLGVITVKDIAEYFDKFFGYAQNDSNTVEHAGPERKTSG